MNEKVLIKMLEKKSAEIIKDCVCRVCGRPICYILTGKGSAVTPPVYVAVEAEQKSFYLQNGNSFAGYLQHEHQLEGRVYVS